MSPLTASSFRAYSYSPGPASARPPPPVLKPLLGLIPGFAVTRPRLSRPWPALSSAALGCSHPPPNRLCPAGTPSTHHLTPPHSSRARPAGPAPPSIPGQSESWRQSGHVVGFCPVTHWAPANQRCLRQAGAGAGQRPEQRASARVLSWSPRGVRSCKAQVPRDKSEKGLCP